MSRSGNGTEVSANAVGRVTLLHLHENGLAAGLLPPVIGQLVNLTKPDPVRFNQFTGNIPPEIGQLSNLDYLDLSRESNSWEKSRPRSGNFRI